MAEIISSAFQKSQSEKALQEREDQLNALLNNVPDMIYRCLNDNNWTMEFISSGCYELTGYQPDELINNNVLAYNDLILPEYRDELWNKWQIILAGKHNFEGEYRITTASGDIKWVWERGNGVFDNQDKLLFLEGYITDITERNIARDALIQSEDKYREILSTMEEGYYEVDLKGNLVFYNDSLSKMFGYSKDELKELTYKEYCLNPDEIFNTYNRVYHTGKPEKAADWVIITKNGKKKFVEVSVSTHRDNEGQIIGFRGIARDITEQKQNEEALKASEERHREILASIEDGYFEVDLKGTVTFCNKASARMLGYTVDEFMSLNYRSFCKDYQLVFNIFNQLFRTGKTEQALAMEMIKKDGSEGYGELIFSLLHDKDGNLIGFRGVGRDVTEQKHYEDQLKYLSLHNQLTGLYNRVYFENGIDRLGSSREHPITIISIDLDGLKLVNDTVGHERGDQLLIACANVLKKSLRSSDTLARVGGDEFVALLPRTDSKTGEDIAMRIHP